MDTHTAAQAATGTSAFDVLDCDRHIADRIARLRVEDNSIDLTLFGVDFTGTDKTVHVTPFSVESGTSVFAPALEYMSKQPMTFRVCGAFPGNQQPDLLWMQSEFCRLLGARDLLGNADPQRVKRLRYASEHADMPASGGVDLTVVMYFPGLAVPVLAHTTAPSFDNEDILVANVTYQWARAHMGNDGIELLFVLKGRHELLYGVMEQHQYVENLAAQRLLMPGDLTVDKELLAETSSEIDGEATLAASASAA